MPTLIIRLQVERQRHLHLRRATLTIAQLVPGADQFYPRFNPRVNESKIECLLFHGRHQHRSKRAYSKLMGQLPRR
jgi:hypothetical protein